MHSLVSCCQPEDLAPGTLPHLGHLLGTEAEAALEILKQLEAQF